MACIRASNAPPASRLLTTAALPRRVLGAHVRLGGSGRGRRPSACRYQRRIGGLAGAVRRHRPERRVGALAPRAPGLQAAGAARARARRPTMARRRRTVSRARRGGPLSQSGGRWRGCALAPCSPRPGRARREPCHPSGGARMVALGESTYTEVSHDDGFPRRCVQRRDGPGRPSRLAPMRRPGASGRRAVRTSLGFENVPPIHLGAGSDPMPGYRLIQRAARQRAGLPDGCTQHRVYSNDRAASTPRRRLRALCRRGYRSARAARRGQRS